MAWHSSGTSNDDLVDNLVENGLITSEAIASAFRIVDRTYFVPEGCEELSYSDRPLKEGNVHISAPHIYCTVVQHLELEPGSSHSFLNIGVGTGYLSSIVATLLGPKSQSFGVEIHTDVIDHCREATRAWKESVDAEIVEPFIFHGNGLQILYEGECRLGFDRIYVGASIDSSELPNLQRLLAPGGILVAPVDDRLTQVRRTMDEYTESTITGVHFAPLIKSPAKKIIIPATIWSPACHILFPEKYQKSVKTLLLSSRSSYIQPPRQEIQTGLFNESSLLPRDIWLHILSFTNRKWFDPIKNETETLKLRLGQAQDIQSELEAEINKLQRENLLLQSERDLHLRLISRIRSSARKALNEQADHLVLAQDPLRRTTHEFLYETDMILNITEVDSGDDEEEDDGMDIEDEPEDVSHWDQSLDQVMETDHLLDRSRTVSITNEEI